MKKNPYLVRKEECNFPGQYSYSSEHYADLSATQAPLIDGKQGQCILVKLGETIESVIAKRVPAQKLAGFTGQILLIEYMKDTINKESHTDDKMREELYQNSDYFMDADDSTWMKEGCWCVCGDLLDKYGLTMGKDIFYFQAFMDDLVERIHTEKLKAYNTVLEVNKIDETPPSKMQEEVLLEMLASLDTTFILFLVQILLLYSVA